MDRRNEEEKVEIERGKKKHNDLKSCRKTRIDNILN